MDNAMVKRGIGAVVLAIIAALLLGWLLKDKSREREDIVDMKLPGAPEITIPSLSDATSKITDSAATLVNETKDTVNNASNAVIDSASGSLSNLTETASETVSSVSDTVVSSADSVVESTTTAAATVSNNPNPGFSFRPSNQNEEQEINTSSSTTDNQTSASSDSSASTSNNTVVASANNTEIKEVKEFKPVIENEPKKAVKKAPAPKRTEAKKAAPKPAPKKAVAKKAAPKKAVATKSTSSKYAIQLLATSSQSRANKLAKTMSSEGYASFITQTTRDNKILYRVRVGGHKDRSAALAAQQSMKRRYQKNFSVQNSLVVSQ